MLFLVFKSFVIFFLKYCNIVNGNVFIVEYIDYFETTAKKLTLMTHQSHKDGIQAQRLTLHSYGNRIYRSLHVSSHIRFSTELAVKFAIAFERNTMTLQCPPNPHPFIFNLTAAILIWSCRFDSQRAEIDFRRLLIFKVFCFVLFYKKKLETGN